MTPHIPPEPGKPPGPGRVIAVVVGIALLIGITLALGHFYRVVAARFVSWKIVLQDLGLTWPPGITHIVATGFSSGAALAFVLAPLVIGLVSLIWCSRSTGGMLCWLPGVIALGGISAIILISSERNIDSWLAKLAGVGLPLDVERFRAELTTLENPQASRADLLRASATIHLISMKMVVGLVERQPEDVERLIALAADEAQTLRVRVYAAKALTVVDDESTAACGAIGSAFRAGVSSSEADVAELASRYRGHPCFVE